MLVNIERDDLDAAWRFWSLVEEFPGERLNTNQLESVKE